MQIQLAYSTETFGLCWAKKNTGFSQYQAITETLTCCHYSQLHHNHNKHLISWFWQTKKTWNF